MAASNRFLAMFAWAAAIFMIGGAQAVCAAAVEANTPTAIGISLSTKGSLVNKIKGRVEYQPELIKIITIDVSKSVISRWISGPEVTSLGIIEFAGEIKNGINGTGLPLFDVKIMSSQKISAAQALEVIGIEAFLDEGLGYILPEKKKLDYLYKHGPRRGFVKTDLFYWSRRYLGLR
ncbi:MAG: hypothetical protein V1821_02720 [bacterium]